MTRPRAKRAASKASAATQVSGVDNVRSTVKKCSEVLEHFKNSLESAGFARGSADYQRMSELLATQRLWAQREASGVLDGDFGVLAGKAAAVYALLKPYASAMARLAALAPEPVREEQQLTGAAEAPAPGRPIAPPASVTAAAGEAVARKRAPARKKPPAKAAAPEPSSEARVLGELAARPRGISVTLLQSRLGLSKTTLEELLSRLETRRLIRRQSSSGRGIVSIAREVRA